MTRTGLRTDSRAAGIAIFVLALTLFASYDAFAKYILQFYPAPFVNLMRYCSIGVIATGVLWQAGALQLWRTPHRGLLVLRGTMLAIVATCFMTALTWMPLAEATALYFTAPLVMVALSSTVLGEHVGRRRWVAVGFGFCGMLLIVRPGNDLPLVGTLLMAVSAVCYAVFQLLTRRLAGLVSPALQYGYMALICFVVTAVPAPFFWLAQPVPVADVLLMLGAAGVSGTAQLLLLAAFRRVEASTLAPLNYLQLLMAVVISSVWFARPPDAIAAAGIGLIVAAGLYLSLGKPARAPATPQAKIELQP
ncbi:MAG: DMT family transporter [Pseudomonadota bacterium]|nr:DMT family transporter [Pseudomonadota bacterium]